MQHRGAQYARIVEAEQIAQDQTHAKHMADVRGLFILAQLPLMRPSGEGGGGQNMAEGDGWVHWIGTLSRPSLAVCRNESDLDAFLESSRDAPQHGERMAFIVRVFQAAN